MGVSAWAGLASVRPVVGLDRAVLAEDRPAGKESRGFARVLTSFLIAIAVGSGCMD
jgi:hypothetical protein